MITDQLYSPLKDELESSHKVFSTSCNNWESMSYKKHGFWLNKGSMFILLLVELLVLVILH